MNGHESNESARPAFSVIAAKAKRHSLTRLLNYVPRVSSFGTFLHEFAMTSAHDSGILAGVLVIGLKSTFETVPRTPIIEMVWSMPPHAVPAILSAVIVRSANYYDEILSRIPFACAVTIAEQTV